MLRSDSPAQNWIAEDPASREVLKIVEKVKDIPATLLIQGESGTGKDFLASLIHYSGSQKEAPLLKIDCASIPRELLESELFGYEKGAFTGAHIRKLGKLEFSGAGTLVLDDIASLELDTQAKLLRVIEEKEFERLGGHETIPLLARIIVLSNRDLAEAVRLRSFREDLFFRLNLIPIYLVPLRERTKDIRPLADHFIGQAKAKYAKPSLKIDHEVFDYLERYAFPGNVRELRNLIERAVMLADSENLTLKRLPGLVGIPKASGSLRSGQTKQTLEQLERSYIEEILEYACGKKGRAAAILGISRKTLLEKRKRYGLMA